MRRLLFAFALSCCFSLLTRPQAQAQGRAARPLLAMATTPAGGRPTTRPAARPAAAPVVEAPAAPATVLLVGRVETVGSNLVGAVVEVAGVRTVTNAAGEFQLQVPANCDDLRVTASYGGFVDQTTAVPAGTRYAVLRLYTPHDVPLSKHQELDGFLKTARKQVRQEMREMRRD